MIDCGACVFVRSPAHSASICRVLNSNGRRFQFAVSLATLQTADEFNDFTSVTSNLEPQGVVGCRQWHLTLIVPSSTYPSISSSHIPTRAQPRLLAYVRPPYFSSSNSDTFAYIYIHTNICVCVCICIVQYVYLIILYKIQTGLDSK